MGRQRQEPSSDLGEVKDAGLLPHRLEGHSDDLFAANDVGASYRNTDAVAEGEHLDAGLGYVERVDGIGERASVAGDPGEAPARHGQERIEDREDARGAHDAEGDTRFAKLAYYLLVGPDVGALGVIWLHVDGDVDEATDARLLCGPKEVAVRDGVHPAEAAAVAHREAHRSAQARDERLHAVKLRRGTWRESG